MDLQLDRDLSRFWKGQAASCGLWLITAALVALSCARVPIGFRSKVIVTGRILAASGDPLPGTTLDFNPTEFKLERFAYATADSSGTYSVQLISGTYNVRIEPPIGSGLLRHTEQATISDKHARLDFTFHGYRVTGRVVTPDGSVIDSGRVYALLAGPERSGATAITKQGSYSLFLPGGRYSIQAMAANYWSGFYPAQRESVPIEADTTIDFRLSEDGIPVSGMVLGPDGLPMRDAGVVAKGGAHPIQTRTSIDGRYRLYVPTGSYRFQFSPPFPFFIVPRIVGPETITEPTSIDGNLSGVEWAGTVQRRDTNEPMPKVIILVEMHGDERGAAIETGSRGDFRFILEAGRSYDLEAYDRERREQWPVVQGLTALADTSLLILLPPTATSARTDSSIKLSIRAVGGETVHVRRRRWPPDWLDMTLENTDPDTVTLVVPNYDGYWGRRPPLMDWEIRSPGGPRLEREPMAFCGNIAPLRNDELFKLPPGAQRTFRIPVPDYYRYEKAHLYQFRLSYENRPFLVGMGSDPDSRRLLQQSTPCKLVSNTLELKVK